MISFQLWSPDSAGIEIIQNSRVGVRHIVLEAGSAILSIGLVEGEEAYLFQYIQGGFILPDTTIVVVDAGSRQIRMFSPSGRHLRTFGGVGKGPGELSGAFAVGVAPPDTLIAWDISARRMTRYERDGAIAGETVFASAQIPLVLSSVDWRVAGDGTLLGADIVDDWGNEVIRIGRDIRLIRDRGAVNISLSLTPLIDQPVVNGYGMLNPFSLHNAMAIRSDPDVRAYLIGDTASWELRTFDTAGSLRSIIRAPVPRTRVTDELYQNAADVAGALRRDENREMAQARRRSFLGMTRPDSTPAVGEIMIDSEGRLWVARWHNPRVLTTSKIYDVFDPNARWRASVEMPEGRADVLDARGTLLALRVRDSLDVERVRIFRVPALAF